MKNAKEEKMERSNRGEDEKKDEIFKTRYNDDKLMSFSWKYGEERFVFEESKRGKRTKNVNEVEKRRSNIEEAEKEDAI